MRQQLVRRSERILYSSAGFYEVCDGAWHCLVTRDGHRKIQNKCDCQEKK